MNPASSIEFFGAVLTGKKWKPGRILRVRHLGGDPEIHKKVELYAKEWEKYANLVLQFVAQGEAEIRISYHLDGNSWSVIGTDALTIAEPTETMHFGWLDGKTTDQETRRVVLHEFGHAIGMIHEQSQPMNTIKWDKPAVYRYYEKLGWSHAKVDFNVFEQYGKEVTQFSSYDPKSIMHYPVDPAFTTDRVGVGWNTDLSPTDIAFISQQYPKPQPGALPPGAVASFGPPHAAQSTPAAAGSRTTSDRLWHEWL